MQKIKLKKTSHKRYTKGALKQQITFSLGLIKFMLDNKTISHVKQEKIYYYLPA